jgi:hypothetical protein
MTALKKPMTSIFVEPHESFALRACPVLVPAPVVMTAREIMTHSMSDQVVRHQCKEYARDLILEILRFEGDVPVRITDLVNRAVRWTPHQCRDHRERAKLDVFRLVGEMARAGALRRVARNFVLIADQEEKDQRQGQQLAPVDLPEPRV